MCVSGVVKISEREGEEVTKVTLNKKHNKTMARKSLFRSIIFFYENYYVNIKQHS